jgi:transcriptional regulator with XRE-family HTH domain
MPSRPGRTKRRSEPSRARRSQKDGSPEKAIPPATVALSRALREARVAAKLNQTDAAKKVGVHFVTIYAWENEKRNDQPSDANLARAAKVYRTTPEELRRRAASIERTLTAGRPAAKADVSASAPEAPPVKVLAAPNGTGADAAAPELPASKVRAKPVRKAAPVARSSGRPASVPVATIRGDRAIVSKVLRVLADVADKVPLTPETLNAAQRALLAPALIDVFAAFKSGPMSDEDINAAFDATGAAVVGFVERRVLTA